MALSSDYYSPTPPQGPFSFPDNRHGLPFPSGNYCRISPGLQIEPHSRVDICQYREPVYRHLPSHDKRRHPKGRQMQPPPISYYRQPGHRAASSESSSLLPLTRKESNDGIPWELTLDTFSLVRHSSVHSYDSSHSPSREQVNNVPPPGRSVIRRRDRSRHGGSSNEASPISSRPADKLAESCPSGPKESLIPALFRRKVSREDSSQRKLQISGPFNFQHLAHSKRKASVSDARSGHRGDKAHNAHFSRLDEPPCPPDRINPDSRARGICPADEVGEPAPLRQRHTQEAYIPYCLPLPREGPTAAARQFATPRQAASWQPQEPHVRLPRFVERPGNATPLRRRDFSLLIPPQGVGEEAMGPLAARGGPPRMLRRPQPLSPSKSEFPAPLVIHRNGASLSGSERSTGPRDVSWPLLSPSSPSFETALADVPEEEEHCGLPRRSRMSLASNKSSLRGSQSAPALRPLAELQRPQSGTSETLGRFDLTAALNAMKLGRSQSQEKGESDSAGVQQNWEDVIDYCYEHEAEADCDYQWERPSLEIDREDGQGEVALAAAEGKQTGSEGIGRAQSCLEDRRPDDQDMPALSPSSQTSICMGNEAITPTSNAATDKNSFSWPRRDDRGLDLPDAQSSRCTSGALSVLSFKESQGFTLSPSLLIPGDYQQQVLMEETARQAHAAYDGAIGPYHRAAFYEDDQAQMGGQSMSRGRHQPRSSTSTTGTYSTCRSTSTWNRHGSANSSTTTFTRHTASSTSLNKMVDEAWAEESTKEAKLMPRPLTSGVDGMETKSRAGTMADSMPHVPQDTVPELVAFPSRAGLRKGHHKNHASESQVPHDGSSPTAGARRNRTTSLNGQATRAGQYGLFPRIYSQGNGTTGAPL